MFWGNKKRLNKMTLVITMTLLMVVLAFSGCVENNGNNGGTTTISIIGSSTVLPIAEICAEEYMKVTDNIQISVAGGGSSVGIKSLLQGDADIGDASRDAKESDVKNQDGTYKFQKEDGSDITLKDLQDGQNIIAYDGIAVVVSPSIHNSVTQLTMDEVYKIYAGEIDNWGDVGGPNESIYIVDRSSSSGTRATFVELIKNSSGTALEDFEETGTLAYNIVAPENSDVVNAVSGSTKAIGYVGLGYVDPTTCPSVEIGVDGTYVEPSISTVKDGSYPISRSLNMYTIGAPTGKVKDFIDYVKSKEGQEWVTEEGFITIL
jgi:phosphate transport system substrate-binding protein